MLSLVRWLYSLLFFLALPLIYIKMRRRARHYPAYKARFGERLGKVPFTVKGSIWVHAVSVGEAITAIYLVNALLKETDCPIVFTTTTPTGSERVKAAFAQQPRVQHCYLPYDVPLFLNRFLNKINPQCLILLETELWPNVLCACQKRRIPVVMANARLSEKSLRGYQYLRWLWQPLLKAIQFVGAQSEKDVQRFAQIGIPPEKIINLGNLKFDYQSPQGVEEKGQKWRETLGLSDKQVWVAASTHDDEEAQILGVYAQLKPLFPRLFLMIVPRHPDRFDAVEGLLKESGFHYQRRSQLGELADNTEVLLGDSMGELWLYYAMSDVVFVGGSLVPVGGHNLLEPAVLGLPIVTGMHLHNFAAIEQLLAEKEALMRVENLMALKSVLMAWLKSPEIGHEQGQRALEVVRANQGALHRFITLLQEKKLV